MIILIVWSNFFLVPPQPTEELPDSTSIEQAVDTIPERYDDADAKPTSIIPAVSDDTTISVSLEPEKTITVETRKAIYTLSSRGGTVSQIILKNYLKYDSLQVTLLSIQDDPEWASYGGLTIGYADNMPEFNNLNFKVDSGDLYLSEGNPSESVVFTYLNSDGAEIVKSYNFSNDSFIFDFKIDIKHPQKLDLGQGVTVGWFAPMETTEINTDDDKGKLGGFFSMGGDFDYFSDFDDGKLRTIVTGPTDWIATRTKYFTVAVMARTSPAREVIVVGDQTSIVNIKGETKQWSRFGTGLTYERPPEELSLDFSVYAGPLDYYALKKIDGDLSPLVEMGWKPFRPFSIAILWVFTWLYKFIPNYGFVIIVFSILMKLVFWPLSIKSAKSMHSMKKLQPMLAELKGKFKDEPAKLQQETMKVYKEQGVNPFGSCLPMLVQLPIFWALYSVLGNTIALRGADFIFWITDLSRPDPSGQWIPLGIGILPIIMGVSMFIQQKITITDPKQKMMVYFMPIIFTFLFSKWASGLVLYWTVFNIMGIFEQLVVKRKMDNEATAQ